MKFKIIEGQWVSSKTYKSHKSTPKKPETKSDPVDSFTSEEDRNTASKLRDRYFFMGAPLGIDKNHV